MTILKNQHQIISEQMKTLKKLHTMFMVDHDDSVWKEFYTRISVVYTILGKGLIIHSGVVQTRDTETDIMEELEKLFHEYEIELCEARVLAWNNVLTDSEKQQMYSQSNPFV